MLVATYYRRSCPYCKKVFQTTLFRNRVRVGPGTRTCSKCKKVVSDESTEWPEMTRAQRRSFLFGGPFWPLVVSGATVSGLLLYALITTPTRPQGTQIILEILEDIWLAYGSILALDFLVSWVQISHSKKRVSLARQPVAERKRPQTGTVTACLECDLPFDAGWQYCTFCGAHQRSSSQMIRTPHEPPRTPTGATSELNQIRINELARELEVRARAIIDYLPEAGVTERKTYSSAIDVATVEKVRKHFREVAQTEGAAEPMSVAKKEVAGVISRAISMMPGAAVEENTAAENLPTANDIIGLEDAVLRVLSLADHPLRARAIAAILSVEGQTPLHKREINPTLYRLLSRGRLFRDSQFRWYPIEKSPPFAVGSIETVSSQPASDFHSPRPSQDVTPVAESSSLPAQAQNEPAEDSSHREPTGVADERKATQTPLPHIRDYGRFRIVEVIRPYVRHCTWCSLEIPEGKVALVVDGLVKMAQYAPRFCSEDCFQNWESIYWQRVALSHLGLSKEERRFEERCLRRQKYFAKFI